MAGMLTLKALQQAVSAGESPLPRKSKTAFGHILEHCSPNESALDAEVLELGRRLGKRKGLRGVSYAFQERATSPVVADPRLREARFRVVDVAPAPRVAPQSASSSPILLALRRRGSDGSGNGGARLGGTCWAGQA
jgi:hypothetical protein